MYCSNCGKELPVSAKFCFECGSKVGGLEQTGNGGASTITDLMNYEFDRDTIESYKLSEEDDDFSSGVATAMGLNVGVQKGFSQAQAKFEKPDKYDRKLIEDVDKLVKTKKDAFNNGKVFDQYTGKELFIKRRDARINNPKDYSDSFATVDHITPLAQVHEKTKNNPFLSTEDVKNIANDDSNYVITSQKINSSKGKDTNEEFLKNDKKMEKVGNNIDKEKLLADQKKSETAIARNTKTTAIKNAASTFNAAGVQSAKSAMQYTVVYDVVKHSIALIKGEEGAEEALKAIAEDTAKAGVTAYLIGGGLTTTLQMLSSSESPFIQSLVKNNVPGKAVMGILMYGGSLKSLCEGKITVGEFAGQITGTTVNYGALLAGSMIGGTLIPIPVVGEVVGSMVCTTISQVIVGDITAELRKEKYEHAERLRIIEQCDRITEEKRRYRKILENELEKYFSDLRYYLMDALSDIDEGFELNDADMIIQGANKITKRMNGTVKYNSVAEFKDYLDDGETDIL